MLVDVVVSCNTGSLKKHKNLTVPSQLLTLSNKRKKELTLTFSFLVVEIF